METIKTIDSVTSTKDGLFRTDDLAAVTYKIYNNGVLTFEVSKRKNPVDGEEKFFGSKAVGSSKEMFKLSVKDAEKWWQNFNMEYHKDSFQNKIKTKPTTIENFVAYRNMLKNIFTNKKNNSK